MADKMIGRWKLTRSENVDEYLNALDYGILYKKFNKLMPYKLDIRRDGDEWTVAMSSPVKSTTNKIRLDETFREMGLDGREMEVFNCFEEGKLMSYRKPLQSGHHEITICLEATDDDLLVQTFTMVERNIVSRRILERYTP